MCRNIRTLHNFEPPATDEEIRASALQFLRKLSGFTRPSKANQAAFSRAVEQVAQAAHELLDALVTAAPPRDREVEAAKARERAADRFRSSDARRGVWREPRWALRIAAAYSVRSPPPCGEGLGVGVMRLALRRLPYAPPPPHPSPTRGEGADRVCRIR